MLLTREAILTAADLKTVDVDVPEWGGTVRVQSMTGAVRDAFGRSLIDKNGKPNTSGYNIKLVAATVVDENGNPLFTPDDIEALGAKSAPALERVADAADKLNELSPGAVETAKGN